MATRARNNAPGAGTSPDREKKQPIRAQINWLRPDEGPGIRATASLTIGGAFAVHGIRIIEGSKGTFVSMPGYRSGDSYKDVFHPITAETRQEVNDAVMAVYEQKLAETREQEQDEPDMEESEDGPEEGQGLRM
jgi:stage V sporulation protein G